MLLSMKFNHTKNLKSIYEIYGRIFLLKIAQVFLVNLALIEVHFFQGLILSNFLEVGQDLLINSFAM